MNKRGKTGNPHPALKDYIPLFIVAIVYAAGDSENLQTFLKNIPCDSGMTYILIQQIDSNHRGLFPETLQLFTPMPVIAVRDLVEIKPDSVYTIAPGFLTSIENGIFRVSDTEKAGKMEFPLNLFLRSLADDRGERAITVILSGTGDDGILGLHAIREKGGVVFIRDPASARFSDMPVAAIDADLADRVLFSKAIPPAILTLKQDLLFTRTLHQIPDTDDPDSWQSLLTILKERTGTDFSLYKKQVLISRIQRRMGILAMRSISDYLMHFQSDSWEQDLLARDMLIRLTPFFQDPDAWEELRGEIIRHLNNSFLIDLPVRAWIPGSYTGEEAYSLAIILNEALREVKPCVDDTTQILQIFASDWDSEKTGTAQKGFYPSSISADIQPDRLSRFFIRREDGFFINNEIRRNIIFTTHDILTDPPFIGIDIICCRNLLLRFSDETQNNIIRFFFNSLKPDGILFLGQEDSVLGNSDLFTRSKGGYLYHRNKNPNLVENGIIQSYHSVTPAPFLKKTGIYTMDDIIEKTISKILMNEFTQPAILINETGDILYVCGKTGKYLEISPGATNLNIQYLARDEIRLPLLHALDTVMNRGGKETVHRIKIPEINKKQEIDLTVQAFSGSGVMSNLFLVVFIPLPEGGRRKRIPSELLDEEVIRRDYRLLQEENSMLREKMQISQKELSSANEELYSRNEELLSFNEELSTSKEELQSLNEELQTLNTEVQIQLAESSRAANDLKNLLDSTEIATIFLDSDLNVRYYTPHATSIFRLIRADIGRPLFDLTTSLIYPELIEDSLAVLRTLCKSERIILTDDKRWISCRIFPYRTFDDRIDGIVITLVDITITKRTEENLRFTLESIRDGFFAVDKDWRIIYINARGEKILGINREEILGMNYWEVLPLALDTILETEYRLAATGEPREFEHFYEPWGRWLYHRCFPREGGGIAVYFLDITKRKKADEMLNASLAKYQALMQNLPVGIVVTDREGRIIECNYEAERLRGCTQAMHLQRRIDGDDWNFIRPDGSLMPPEEFAGVRALKEKRTINDIEMGYIKDDTKICWMSVTAVPTLIAGLGAVILYQDITRRKEAEIEQKRIEEALFHLNQQLNLMNGITRHDILNKVCVLQLILNDISEKNDPFSGTKRFSELEVTTLEIKKQIEFTRIFQDMGSQKPMWQNINTILSGLQFPENITFTVHMDDMEVLADPLLERVFYNFLDNSLRHGQNVSLVSVYDSLSPQGYSVIWEDNGCGIPALNKTRIFEKEFGKNTGYGLFFTKEVLAITGMKIRETGEEGKGARFEILIPEGAYRNSETKYYFP